MKVLLVGDSGQLSLELQKDLLAPYVLFSHRQLHSESGWINLIEQVKTQAFTHLINTVAYTAVDQAESEQELAFTINRDWPKRLAKLAKEFSLRLIHFSTDYVFDGHSLTPYQETDQRNPLSVYGQSKAQGELAVIEVNPQYWILRTAWVYSQYRKNFMLTMLKTGLNKNRLEIVNDKKGCPTWTGRISLILNQMLRSDSQLNKPSEIYHLTARGEATWFEFAKAIFSQVGKLDLNYPLPHLEPILSTAYRLPAPRPDYSVLDVSKITRDFNVEIKDWVFDLESCLSQEFLKRFMTEQKT